MCVSGGGVGEGGGCVSGGGRGALFSFKILYCS